MAFEVLQQAQHAAVSCMVVAKRLIRSCARKLKTWVGKLSAPGR